MNREEGIKKAAKWWGDKVCGPVRHDNGDNSRGSMMAMLLADLGSSPVSNNAAEVFQKELISRINASLNSGNHRVYLDVDYHPCEMLSQAAKVAGVNTMNFPFKTNMYIEVYGDECKVEVSDGYGRPYTSL